MASDDGIRYVPSKDKAPYKAIMNSDAVQKLLLERANKVQNACISKNIYPTADVRPGKMRAHAIVSARRWQRREDKTENLHAYGHNRRVDLVLVAALDAARW